jgi:hypothetical protein
MLHSFSKAGRLLRGLPAHKRGAFRGTVGAVVILALAAGVAGVVRATMASAGASGEPASFARKATLKVATRALNARSAPRSSIVGADLVPGKGGGAKVRLGGGEEVIAALTGSLVPVAVAADDESVVAYSSWHQLAQLAVDTPGQGLKDGDPVGRPSIRVYDASSDKDKLVANGAYAPALSVDGRLAFVKGDDAIVRQNREYTGKVMVGSARGGTFSSWTRDSARYFPYAWAGDSLLVYRARPQSEGTDLYVFTGPDESRLLAPNAFAIALSPDGARVLVTVDRQVVEVVRIADGAIESSFTLDGPGVAGYDSASTPHALMYAGSWSGDRIVANSDVGLVVLNAKDGLRIESVFKTPFAHGVTEPTFVDDSTVVGWANLEPVAVSKTDEPAYTHALVSCDLATASCAQSASQPARSWTRWVTNPSR